MFNTYGNEFFEQWIRIQHLARLYKMTGTSKAAVFFW